MNKRHEKRLKGEKFRCPIFFNSTSLYNDKGDITVIDTSEWAYHMHAWIIAEV